MVQTLLLIVTTPGTVQGSTLATVVAMVVKLHHGNDPALSHMASAAVGQMVSSVLDRVSIHSEALDSVYGQSVTV